MCRGMAHSTSEATHKDDSQSKEGPSNLLPELPKPRKFQYLPCATTPKWWQPVILLLWFPMGIVLFLGALATNLTCWVIAYCFLGGAIGLARRTTLPRYWNFALRWIYSLIDVVSIAEIPKPWDPNKAKNCYEAFRIKNGFSKKDVKVEIRTIASDEVTKPDVFAKFYKLDRYPNAKLSYTWVLCAPSKTFIVTSTNFCEFDGTSCFNIIKGFVHTYYENGVAPLIRPQAGNKELDLQLDPMELKDKLTAWLAFKVCFKSAFYFGMSYGKAVLSREVFDMLACPSPTNNFVIETLDDETNAALTAKLRQNGGKMFPFLMSCSAQALANQGTKVEDLVLLSQVSCQSRYYKPAVPRNVAGNWLIGLGAKVTLTQLSDRLWAKRYHQSFMNHIQEFSGTAAEAFINQSVFGLMGTWGFANPRKVYWFNNYGLRDMHPDAGGVTYHWGPNYGVATYCLVNVVTVDGNHCITLMSSVLPPGELKAAAKEMKQIMMDTCDHPWNEVGDEHPINTSTGLSKDTPHDAVAAV